MYGKWNAKDLERMSLHVELLEQRKINPIPQFGVFECTGRTAFFDPTVIPMNNTPRVAQFVLEESQESLLSKLLTGAFQ
jgi:hypothetical protein